MWIEGIALIYIGICVIFDIRSREIPLSLLLLGIAAAVGAVSWQITKEIVTVVEVGISLLPGIFFLLTGFMTREKVGYGDGLMLMAIGLFLGAYQCFLALGIGLVFSAAISLLLLMLRRADRHSRIPFAPFLLLGMGVVIFA